MAARRPSTAVGTPAEAGAPTGFNPCCYRWLDAVLPPVAQEVALPPLPAAPEAPPAVQLLLPASPVQPVEPVLPDVPEVTVVVDEPPTR